MLWNKEQFENSKRMIEEDNINMVKELYKESLEYAAEHKADYERYIDEEKWSCAFLFFTQYNKNDILAKSYKAYLDILENKRNEATQ